MVTSNEKKTIYSFTIFKICSEHFLSSVILDRPGTYKKHLKPDAVSTVFPAMPSYYQPIPKKPRRKVQRTIPKEVTVLRSNENHQVMSSINENNTEVSAFESNLNLVLSDVAKCSSKMLFFFLIFFKIHFYFLVKVLQDGLLWR